MRYSLIIFALCALVSCSSNTNGKNELNSESKIEKKKKSGGLEVYRPKLDYEPLSSDGRYLMSSNGSIDGSIIKNSKIPYEINIEYDEDSKMLNETISTKDFSMVSHFNKKGKIVKFERFTAGTLDMVSETEYDQFDNIIKEIEREINGADERTTLFEYHYKYVPGGENYVAFRTNNSDTVTRYTQNKVGNKLFKTSEIYPKGDYEVTKSIEVLLDENKRPVQTYTETKSKSRSDDEYDVRISKLTNKYNKAGQIVEEKLTEDGMVTLTSIKYSNGRIQEKRVGNNIVEFHQFDLK